MKHGSGAFPPAGAFVVDLGEQVGGGRKGLCAIAAKDFEGHRAACHMKPLAAAVLVAPAFKVHALGVAAHEEIAFEIILRGTRTKAFQVRFAVGVEFGFLGGDVAVGAVDI